MQEIRPGFEAENLLTASCVRVESGYPDFEARRDFYERLASRVSAIPGAKAAALSDTLPLGTFRMNNSYEVEGQPQPPGQWFLGYERSVTPGFFRAMGIPLVLGRDFTPRDADLNVVIINQHIARKHWQGESPLGKRISLGGPVGMRTVIGVVGNVRQDSLIEPDHGETYKPLAQENRFQYVSFVLRVDGDPQLFIPALKAAVQEIDAGLAVYDTKTGIELVGRHLALASASSTLIGGLGVLALLLAAVGLNGVMSLLVGFRTQEIGIRIALGARVTDILRMVLGEGMMMVLLGTGLGLAGAFGLGRAITSLLYGVEPTDPTTFILAPLVLVAVALVSCFFPARRAASLHPTVALRRP
jgi:putative ABC transport system permease protein